MISVDAVILSAGYGERLRPITNALPKALLPVLGKPVMIRIYEKLKALKPEKIFVNTHYLYHMVERAVVGLKEIEIVRESKILGTGGAIVNVAKRSKSGHILVYNSDVLTDADIKSVIDFHINSGMDITLVVSKRVPKKNILVERGFFKGIGVGEIGFTGIAIYRKGLLEKFEIYPFDAKEIWLKASKMGYKVGVFEVNEEFWYDIGTPDGYARAIFSLLKRMGERIFVNVKRGLLPPLNFDGFLVLEGEPGFEEGVFLRNVIILGDVTLKKGVYKNCIVSPSGIAYFDEFFSMEGEGDRYLIGLGGSDRKFWRVYEGNVSFVLCDYGKNEVEFEKHLKATEFLTECGVPVPKILKIDRSKNHVYMEDFGDTTLYNHFRYRGNRDFLEHYAEALRIIARLHAIGPHLRSSRYFNEFSFDFEYFKWEQVYFLNNFVKRFFNVEISEEVESELDELADVCSKFEKVVLHRDFQSQNIMVKSDGSLGVIDFTGLRWGPKSYDVVSLVFDPYMPSIKDYRDELLEIYIKEFNSISRRRISPSELEQELKLIRLQRHMQALGAYGFLSRVKGKRYFEKFILSGLNFLVEDLNDPPMDLPFLKLLVNELFKQLLDTKDIVEYNYLL